MTTQDDDAGRARLVWAVAANIVEHTRAPQMGSSYRGTRLFRAGAKVYLASMTHWHSLDDEAKWTDNTFEVIGQHRLSRKWIKSWVNGSALHRWRITLMGTIGAVRLLEREQWWGFRIAANEFTWDGDKASPAARQALFERMRLRLPADFSVPDE